MLYYVYRITGCGTPKRWSKFTMSNIERVLLVAVIIVFLFIPVIWTLRETGVIDGHVYTNHEYWCEHSDPDDPYTDSC